MTIIIDNVDNDNYNFSDNIGGCNHYYQNTHSKTPVEIESSNGTFSHKIL